MKTNKIEKWSPVFENLNISDEKEKAMLASLAEQHLVNENQKLITESSLAYTNASNILGMGNVVGAQPSSTVAGAYGTAGSGDLGKSYVSVAMKIAYKTIGMELVTSKNVATPKVDLAFIDFPYAGGKLDGTVEKPIMFKIKATGNLLSYLTTVYAEMKATGLRAFLQLQAVAGTATTTLGTEPTVKTDVLEFLQFGSIDGSAIFRVFVQSNTASAGAWGFDPTLNTFSASETILQGLLNGNDSEFGEIFKSDGVTSLASATLITNGVTVNVETPTIALVSTLEDHVFGFSSNFKNAPMTRAESEASYFPVIGVNAFTQSVQIGEYKVSGNITRQQMTDIRALTGQDILQKMKAQLVNEIAQDISKDIVNHVKTLGRTNRAVKSFDFNVDTYLTSVSSTIVRENYSSLQRKLVTRLDQASNYISTQGRVGRAQYIVTNIKLASVLKDIQGYVPVPVNAKFADADTQLYPMGTVNGMTIYVDQNQTDTENFMYLGRKNKEDEPGLLFLVYLMAESFELITESQGSPKLFLTSRCAVAPIGFFPEKQFMAIQITDANNILS